MILLVVSLVVFLLYCIITTSLFGLVDSLSETYYKLEEKMDGLGFLFSAVCILLGSSLMYPMIEMSNELWYMELLAFLTAGLLLFVSVSVEYREKLSGRIHYTSAILMVVTSQLWVILDGGSPEVLLMSALTMIMSLWRIKSYVLWAEVFYGIGTLSHLILKLYE